MSLFHNKLGAIDEGKGLIHQIGHCSENTSPAISQFHKDSALSPEQRLTFTSPLVTLNEAVPA